MCEPRISSSCELAITVSKILTSNNQFDFCCLYLSSMNHTYSSGEDSKFFTSDISCFLHSVLSRKEITLSVVWHFGVREAVKFTSNMRCRLLKTVHRLKFYNNKKTVYPLWGVWCLLKSSFVLRQLNVILQPVTDSE